MAIHNEYKHNQYQRIVPFIIFVLALFLYFKLIEPTITLLLSSLILSYLAYPLSQKIMGKIHHRSISIILSLLIIVIIVLIPFSILAFEITPEGYYFYNSLSSNIEKGALFGFGCLSADSQLCSLINRAEKFSIDRLSRFGFDEQLHDFLRVLEQKVYDFIQSIPLILTEIVLALFISYFIIDEWEALIKKTIDLLPMRKKTIHLLIKEFGNITHTVIYARLFVALVQGVVGSIGLYLIGFPYHIILGLMMAICALIPYIGTAIVWAPISLFMMASGYFSADYWVLGKGIGLFFYGLLITSTIDNLLLVDIVHARAKVNQISIIIGFIGGISMFGVMGTFIGPILLPLLMTYFETFKERFM